MRDDSTQQPAFDLLDPETKEWIDARASWIVHQFGRDRIRTCQVVLPTPEFFPPHVTDAEAGAREELDRIGRYLDIDPQSLDLSFFAENKGLESHSQAAGYYEEQQTGRFQISIEVSQLKDPMGMAATMAHELCHVHLLGHGRISGDEDDHEPLTDLLTVFLGLGIITANAVLHDSNWSSGTWEGWQIGRKGYLTMSMFGYALALFAHVRGEPSPTWEKHLRPDVRFAFQQSRQFFAKHGLPDLRTVKETAARPVLVQSEWEDEKDPHGELLEIGDGECIYCGAEYTLPVGEEAGDDESLAVAVCGTCLASIDQNDLELTKEREAAAAAEWWRNLILKGFFLGVTVFIVVAVILEMLGKKG